VPGRVLRADGRAGAAAAALTALLAFSAGPALASGPGCFPLPDKPCSPVANMLAPDPPVALTMRVMAPSRITLSATCPLLATPVWPYPEHQSWRPTP
jgi:hypothetical protein